MDDIVEALKRVHLDEDDAKEVAGKLVKAKYNTLVKLNLLKDDKRVNDCGITAPFEIHAVLSVARMVVSEPRAVSSPRARGGNEEAANKSSSSLPQVQAVFGRRYRFALPRDCELIARKQAAYPTSKRLFAANVNVGNIPLVVHPRDTVASRICGKRTAQIVFNARKFSMSINGNIAHLACIVVGILVIFGILPGAYGFITLFPIPALLLGCMLLNAHLVKAVLRTFDFWLLIVLGFLGMAGLIDGVSRNPGAICACCVLGLSLIYSPLLDARSPLPPLKARQAFLSTIMLLTGNFITLALVIAWYYLGLLRDFKQRLIPLPGGFLVLDVQSTAFSFLTTYLFLQLRFLVSYIRNPNALLLIRARIEYEMLQAEDPSLFTAPANPRGDVPLVPQDIQAQHVNQKTG
jgi:hypothetical protein